MDTRIVSKFYRLKLTDEIKLLLTQLPVKDISERKDDNSVYSGSGEITIGVNSHPVEIKIGVVNKKPWVRLVSERIGVDVDCEFMSDSADTLKALILNSLN